MTCLRSKFAFSWKTIETFWVLVLFWYIQVCSLIMCFRFVLISSLIRDFFIICWYLGGEKSFNTFLIVNNNNINNSWAGGTIKWFNFKVQLADLSNYLNGAGRNCFSIVLDALKAMHLRNVLDFYFQTLFVRLIFILNSFLSR